MRTLFVLTTLLALGPSAAGEPPAPAPGPVPPTPGTPAAPVAPGNPVPPPTPSSKPAERLLTPEQAADAVLALRKGGGVAGLGALAAKDVPDPWLVADELLARGEFEAAEAFARAAPPRKDVDTLPAHVAGHGSRGADAAARATLVAANAALAAKRWTDALAAVEAAKGPRDGVVGVRLEFGRGLALRGLERLDESAAAFLGAAKAAEELGWLARAAKALQEGAMSSYARDDARGAAAAWTERLRVEERRGDRAGMASALGSLGVALEDLAEYAKALDAQQRAARLGEELGDLGIVARAWTNIGVVYEDLGEYAKALEADRKALDLKRALKDRSGVVKALTNLGLVQFRTGDFRGAVDSEEEAVRLAEELGDAAGASRALSNLGNAFEQLGDHAKALEVGQRVLKLDQERGDRRSIATDLGNLGIVHERMGDYAQAQDLQERALAMHQETGNRAGVARALANLGNVHVRVGAYARAVEAYRQVLPLMEASGDRPAVATTLANLGVVHDDLGEYAKAMDFLRRALSLDEALGNEAAAATALGNLGILQLRTGDLPGALATAEDALKRFEAIGDRAGVARILSNLGSVHEDLGNATKALDFHRRAMEAEEAIGDTVGAATEMGNIGNVFARLGEHPKALEWQQRALALAEAKGDRAGVVRGLVNVGVVLARLGEHAKALESLARGLEVANELGSTDGVVRALRTVAEVHRAAGRPRDAIRAAREAVERGTLLVRGHSDGRAASVRSVYAEAYEVGLAAALDVDDVDGAIWFAESGRAGALLEAMRARDVVPLSVLPRALFDAASSARVREASAAAGLARAREGGDLAAIRAARAQLDTARGAVSDVVGRIQEQAKAFADVAYPKPDAAAAIRARLHDGEVLLLPTLLDDAMGGATALVLTSKGSRTVRLGRSADIEAAIRALEVERKDSDVATRIARLRSLLVDPLRLDGAVTRLLVSPAGSLSYVPFGLLAPERDVAYVPSGTTLGVLSAHGDARGDGVLALGDPDYDAQRSPPSAPIDGVPRNAGPGRLPATAAEARAVGTTTLLGRDATEAGLRAALSTRKRWRAVHLACHGSIDRERPELSWLALSPTADDEGHLTVNEVLGLTIEADLVVLSACATGTGRIYRGEGIVGLTRAFMYAGAPRVLCSLWKVDDDATRALMERFYASWDPKDGSKPMGAAAALRAAQEHVRSHEIEVPDEEATRREGHPVTRRARPWAHPYYWAAWVLWGLP